MVEEKYIKISFTVLVISMILIAIARLAVAAPELQGGLQGMEANQDTGAGQSNPPLVCAQTYVVQRDDWLSKIAEKFYGDVLAYPIIFQATNAAVGTDGFTPIRDPNIIEPGQVLCIPALTGVIASTASAVITSTGQFTLAENSIAGLTFNLTPEQGVLLVENRANGDFVFDLTQPLPGSALVAPNHLQPFIVPRGLQGYMAHHPIGAFSITPGQVQVAAGQITHLICFRDVCQLASLVQPSASQAQPVQQQVNQPVVAGQPPPPAPDLDNDNDNDDNDNDDNDNDDNDNDDNDNDDNDNDDNDND
jgi:LysM repeat protein